MKSSQWVDVLNRGLMWNEQGEFERGFPLIEEAYPHIPEVAGLGYAEALARKGHYNDAFQLYEKYRPSKKWFKVDKWPEWKGESLSGKRIIVLSEGGYGDVLMNVRFVPRLEAAGASVTVAAWKPLVPLFEHQIFMTYTGEQTTFDYWVSVVSLPYRLGTNSVWDGPYIKPRKSVGATDGHIGICLKAGAMLDAKDHRSMPEELRARFMDSLHCPYVLLSEQNKELKNWDDTAAAIDRCECVATVDTAVAHLAGAMGKETHLLLGDWSDWKWGIGTDKTAWYPSMTIHRKWDFNKVLDRANHFALI